MAAQEGKHKAIRLAIITFNLQELQKEAGTKDVAALIDSLGMSIEALDEEEIKIDVTPNRPDLLDFFGMARALSYLSGKREPSNDSYLKVSEPRLSITVSKNVKDVRPFIAGIVVEYANLGGNRLKYLINFTEKIAETFGRHRKKIAIGIHNLDRIDGDLTYEVKKSGSMQPLGLQASETFEKVLRSQKGTEYGAIAEGKNIVLSDEKKVIALIPITNSEKTRVTEGTKNLFIDITGTSQKAVGEVATLLACSFIDQNAKVSAVSVDYGSRKAVYPSTQYKEEKINVYDIDRTIGAKLSESDIVKLANRLGYKGSKYGNYILVEVPPYRMDFINCQDVIEDMAIAFGYNNIVPLPVVGSSFGCRSAVTDLCNDLELTMTGMGFDQAINNYITNEETQFDRMEQRREQNLVKISYSKTASLTALRSKILPSLLTNLSASQHESMPLRLFEIGSVFTVEKNRAIEGLSVALVSEAGGSNFSEAKSYVVAIAASMGMPIEIRGIENPAFIKGRCAGVFLHGKRIGVFGEIHPKVLKNFNLAEPAIAAELSLIAETESYRR
jgi:phenylalanyl-tRNA synthetase beta chain